MMPSTSIRTDLERREHLRALVQVLELCESRPIVRLNWMPLALGVMVAGVARLVDHGVIRQVFDADTQVFLMNIVAPLLIGIGILPALGTILRGVRLRLVAGHRTRALIARVRTARGLDEAARSNLLSRLCGRLDDVAAYRVEQLPTLLTLLRMLREVDDQAVQAAICWLRSERDLHESLLLPLVGLPERS